MSRVLLRAFRGIDADHVVYQCWDVMQGQSPFFGANGRGDEQYSYEAHLAQMIEVMGAPPDDLVTRSHFKDRLCVTHGTSCFPLDIALTDPAKQGHLSTQFDVPARDLGDTLTALDWQSDEKTEFLRFVKRILVWDPEQRATVSELLDDPAMRALDFDG